MREPQRGVPKLDGTNLAQQVWWEERTEELEKTLAARMQGAQGPELQQLLDEHLADLEALKVEMPAADDFRLKHIQTLASIPKQNPVQPISELGPPLRSPPEADEPPFIGDSLEQRKHRRGRFMGRPKAAILADDPEHLEMPEAAMPVGVEAEPSSASARGRRSARRATGSNISEAKARQADFIEEAEEIEPLGVEADAAPIDPMEPLRNTSLGDLWSSYGASWAEFNRCVVPSEYPPPTSDDGIVTGSTMHSYYQARERAAIFDISYKVGMRVTGPDREFVADQFLTCKLSAMRPGDVQYACVLDSKGFILDDAFVYLTDDAVEILSSGCHSRQVMDYIGQYVVYVRRTGADVGFEESAHTAGIAVQGPKSPEAMVRALSRLAEDPLGGMELETVETEPQKLPPSAIEPMPYMSCVRLRPRGGGEPLVILRAGTTGEDGFEITASSDDPGLQRLAEALLQESDLVRPAGVNCLDVLRMEAGLPRVGTDIPPGKITPIRASLIWVLDQAKMRNHLMFGWQKLFFQLAKGPKFRRVGLLLEGPGHTGCRLMSNPHRQPIGEISSVAWSPTLKSRVAQAYIRPEYARANKHILVNVPYNLPTHKMRKKAIQHWTKTGMLRSSYRRLVPACVVPLPFVPHRCPEPARQRKAAARVRPFSPAGVREPRIIDV